MEKTASLQMETKFSAPKPSNNRLKGEGGNVKSYKINNSYGTTSEKEK